MADNCPRINFGIPSDGAKEYNMNSGRELFRCGTGCVKMFITNVTMEVDTVTYTCASIDDANLHGTYCLKSAQISKREQGVVNWIAKDNVDSKIPIGSVLTKADLCLASGGNDPMIYTHTEGNLSIRVTINIDQVSTSYESIKNDAEGKFMNDPDLQTEFGGVQWILSDVGTNASPTDWQGGSVTYQGFGSQAHNYRTARASFNWDNGRMEKSLGNINYDQSDNQDIGSIIDTLIA